ncbi:Plasmodesmata callose-binding protein 3 [Senna tora]|uniref:Plasmodesmata callose-binding protein 3 n=1 Tax=Senna tora TaxID=362788 RepID=A0A834TUD9_9FABA|nr:Plasmodesmata callose-binding protein 3 [Senna tora]
MALWVCLLLLSALIGHSSGLYCVCKDGVGDQALQKTLDYACGAGADCTPILQNGACYNPNTVKDHCNYAVNSYFQRKGQAQGSCDFSGTATTSQTAPAAQELHQPPQVLVEEGTVVEDGGGDDDDGVDLISFVDEILPQHFHSLPVVVM